jgi:uridine phosphorylase
MSPDEIPILQFDPNPNAVINPGHGAGREPVPGADAIVMSFFAETIEAIALRESLPVVASVRSEMGEHRVFQVEREGVKIGLFHVGVGAPLAAGQLEEVIAHGYRTVVVCGSAGVLDSAIDFASVMVCEDAVRDEGTSYHYLPAGETASADPEVTRVLSQTLEDAGVAHFRGRSWTTDAFYRETPAKIARRREADCRMVEMEASALFAVARFRGIRIGQLLYGGDDVSGLDWDPRSWPDKRHGIRGRLVDLSLQAAARLVGDAAD